MIRSGCLVLFLSTLIFSCGDAEHAKENVSSPRVKKATTLDSPLSNQQFVRGENITLSFSSDDVLIDSVQVTLANETKVYQGNAFQISLPNSKVGSWWIRTKVFFGSQSEAHSRKIVVLSENRPQEMTYQIINTYPHDTEDFTQGLLIKDGYLYESTGQNGSSTFKKKELKTGKTLQTVNLDQEYFGEGLAAINDEFYQLTWTSGIGFVYNADMEQVRTFNISGQGYGLTTLGEQLLYTDESEKIFFIEPQSFSVQDQIEAYDNTGKADSLNELEIINGLIYANVWLRDIVVAIEPTTGEVVQKIDFSGLLSDAEARKAGVINGIAVDPKTNKIYITGKHWPKLFEVTIEPKTIQ